jgi:nitroreductase
MTTHVRKASAKVEPLFLDRWSPRAFDESSISSIDLDAIFEAASWAPSAFNYQPWRFLFAHRDSADWPLFLESLLPFNQSWAERASVLVAVLSDTQMAAGLNAEPQPSYSHSFDAGAAWALLALQAARLGYHAHGMTGVDFERLRERLAIPERFRIEAAVAIGRRADKSILPQSLQPCEQPSGRKTVAEIAFEGRFPGSS